MSNASQVRVTRISPVNCDPPSRRIHNLSPSGVKFPRIRFDGFPARRVRRATTRVRQPCTWCATYGWSAMNPPHRGGATAPIDGIAEHRASRPKTRFASCHAQMNDEVVSVDHHAAVATSRVTRKNRTTVSCSVSCSVKLQAQTAIVA